MSELNQLLLDFDHKQNFSYNDFYVSESNYYAFKIIESWPKWDKNIVNVFGESGCGKSHLSGIFQSKYKAKILDEKDLNNDNFKFLKVHQNIILDNFNNKTDEKLLYSLFNLDQIP